MQYFETDNTGREIIMASIVKEFAKGLWKENPVLVLALGMCPTLATSSNAANAVAMGLATTFVLMCSNAVISVIRNIVPGKIRIPCYIVIIATFVTVVELLMKAYAPVAIYQALGIFLPLIVVNCIVLGRAEAFASKHGILLSLADGLGMGLGFTLALTVVGIIREFLSAGTIFNIHMECWDSGFSVLGQAPGGFIVLGLLLAGMNYWNMRKAQKAGIRYIPAPDFDCRHCALCSWDGKMKKQPINKK
jgi:electron transport complex protein RnfE